MGGVYRLYHPPIGSAIDYGMWHNSMDDSLWWTRFNAFACELINCDFQTEMEMKNVWTAAWKIEKSLYLSLFLFFALIIYPGMRTFTTILQMKRNEPRRNETKAALPTQKEKLPKPKKNRKIIKRNVICFLITYDENERHNQMGKTMKTQEEGAEEREMLSSLSACCQHSQFIS